MLHEQPGRSVWLWLQLEAQRSKPAAGVSATQAWLERCPPWQKAPRLSKGIFVGAYQSGSMTQANNCGCSSSFQTLLFRPALSNSIAVNNSSFHSTEHLRASGWRAELPDVERFHHTSSLPRVLWALSKTAQCEPLALGLVHCRWGTLGRRRCEVPMSKALSGWC